MASFVLVASVCVDAGVHKCVPKILWVLILKPVLRRGKHVIQVSHGIVLPVKLHYQSWGDCVGNRVFPNQVLKKTEPMWCEHGSNQANTTVSPCLLLNYICLKKLLMCCRINYSIKVIWLAFKIQKVHKNTLFLRLKNNICAFEKLLIDI